LGGLTHHIPSSANENRNYVGTKIRIEKRRRLVTIENPFQ